MRTRILLPALFAFCSTAIAQSGRSGPGLVPQRIDALRQSGTTFQPVALFTSAHADDERDALWHAAVDHATLLTPSRGTFAEVLSNRPGYLHLDLPAEGGSLSLDLEQVSFFTDDFSVVTASNGQPFPYTAGLYYRGAVSGDPNSLVAISIFKDELMGFVSKADGDFTIGKLQGDAAGTHILYRTDDLLELPTGACGTEDDGHSYSPEELAPVGDNRTVKCVRLYWEVNYDIFQGKGSVTNATNYVTGLFNQTAVLYNNDGISVTLSQVYVWDVASPYTSTSTSTLLDQFGNYRTSFNGDLAHLLGYAGGGGIAWLNGLCNSQPRYKMAYSGISSSYSSVPTFSWSVEVVTHEQGHLMGSRHTHACAWNGNSTAIDGCGPAAGYTEGTCATAALPSGGGTIMSYCHLVSGVGINFNNGFGPQPTTLIVNNINNASCLSACTGTSCAVPGSLGTSNVTTSGATLTWGAVSGVTGYSLQWKLTSAGTWTTVTGLTSTSYGLSGLSANTGYQFQVLAVCSGGSSAYSSAASFTTLGTAGCPDIQEPNGTTATAGTITSGTAYNAIISSATDADYYKLVLSATSNITVSLGNLPFDYDLRLLNSAGTEVATSTAGNTTAESITYNNAVAGNYFVHVYGYNGVFSTTNCYAVTATATVVAATCTDNYEPNETNGGARTIGTNNAKTARIGSATDIDWFKFSNTDAQRYIKLTLTNLPANYDMQLWRGSGQLGTSQNSGTTSEQIIYNSNTISSNYRVKVYGVSGAFNASACYTITVQISGTAFMPSGELEGLETVVDGISSDGTLAVFPNPARETVNVVIPAGTAGATVDLMDATGRVAMNFTSQAGSGGGAEQRIVMDVRDLAAGIWFLRVVQDGIPTVQRVVIEH